jgi:glucose/arabinose dehydrogenase
MLSRCWHLMPGVLLATAVAAAPGPPPAGYSLTRISDAVPAGALAGISQLAFRPGDATHLFAVRSPSSAGVVSRYDVDPASEALSNPVDVATSLPMALGLAFRDGDLFVSLKLTNDSRITRLRDVDHDGIYEERADFVRGVPNRDHGIDQLQIVGATLFAPIGTRWNSGDPSCESVYTGTIARIADLDQIDYSSGANYLPGPTGFLDPVPADGFLRRYAYGFRNPFGIRVDPLGQVWVSDNGASACNTCSSCSNFPIDTPDFLYAAVPPGAKGQFPPAGYPGGGGATITPLAILATHAAVTGFDWIASGPDAGRIVLAEFGASNPDTPAGRDLVLVDPTWGTVSAFVSGFLGPTDVIADSHGRLLIADYLEPAVYLLTPPGVAAVELLHAGPSAPRIDRIVPNPASASLRIEYSLPVGGEVRLSVCDVTGREVARSRDRDQSPGAHEWRLTTDGRSRLGVGIYFCRIETPAGSAARRFAVVH